MGANDAFKVMFAGVAHPHADLWATGMSDAGANIVGVYDPVGERSAEFARTHSTEACGLDRISRGGIDAVIVDGRNDEVTEVALAALEEGYPLLLEKPGGMSASELERVEEQARSAGAVVQLGYFLRYANSVDQAKRMLDGGELGGISLARFHAGMPRTAWEELGEWFRDPANIVGVFQEDACHIVDIALHLLGEPRAVSACRAFGGFEGGMGEDALVAILDYRSFLAVIEFSAWEANPWIETWCFEIYGTDATVRAGLTPAWLERLDEHGYWQSLGAERSRTRAEYDRCHTEESRIQFKRGSEAFIRAVRGEAPSPVDVSAGVRVFRLIEAVYEAASSGSAVPFAVAKTPSA
jgi:predicted dehydrogenase